jgi:hypothetical protein
MRRLWGKRTAGTNNSAIDRRRRTGTEFQIDREGEVRGILQGVLYPEEFEEKD